MIDELLEKRKSPTSKRRYVGIEIEFLIPRGNYGKLEKALYDAELQWNVNLGEDSSVNDIDFKPDYKFSSRNAMITNLLKKKTGHEIRILVEEDEAPSMIRQVCDIIKSVDGSVNTTCGLHVHLDMRSRDYEKSYTNLYRLQEILFSTQPKHRRNNEYVERVRRLKRSEDDYDHHDAISRTSYDEHRTIEVRMHEGTIDSEDINMWTGFLINIVNMETVLKKKVSSVSELTLPNNLKEHLNDRIKRFSSNGKTNSSGA